MASLSELAIKAGVKYVLFSFTDMFNCQRTKMVPLSCVESMQKDGACFAGSGVWLDLSAADADVQAVPDPASFCTLPWQLEVGWVACDCYVRGQPLLQSPRVALRNALDKLKQEHGLQLKTGVELEFMLLTEDGKPVDRLGKSARTSYDQGALMRRYTLMDELMCHMQSLGWSPYKCEHGDVGGQMELCFSYADALTTADRTCFFKHMVKTLAERHGFMATFMPKPFADLAGNSAHAHITLHRAVPGVSEGEDIEGHNVFERDSAVPGAIGYDVLSDYGRQFVAGLLRWGRGLAAFTNPTVNSYKRLHCNVPKGGEKWSPELLTWGGNDRTVAIRCPDAPRIEIRTPDGAHNPYLAPAAYLAAGMQGVLDGSEPPKPGNDPSATELPNNLLDALRDAKDGPFRSWIGSSCLEAYLELKYQHEWCKFQSTVSQWEFDSTLDC
eukprot:TRINITY_DN12321_c0_g1_i1.p1 TRINITY_DN12321_c0_g1~~TRINITY_DN12321_c0_g1_i1.p1  ORF type:complete len:441 (+),score=136.88 TRINITY_DN12321_c0_g1_i1:75-1397(+)